MVSGSGSNMAALVHACEAGEVPGTVVAVVADRDCRGIEVAAAAGIPTQVVSPAAYDDRDAWSRALRDVVASYRPDLVVSAGFMRILAPVFVDSFDGRLINLHPSLLPAFPGAHAVRDALEAGADETGSTVHFIDHDVDHGPVILQEPVRIEEGDDEATLHERIKSVEHRLLPRACTLVLEGRLRVDEDRVHIR